MEEVIRKTHSLCNVCKQEVEATVSINNNEAYLIKSCPKHGRFDLLLSHHAWYYSHLDKFYFSVMPSAVPQRDFLVHLTSRCNLNCPICLASSNQRDIGEYSKEQLKEFLRGKRGSKIGIMGAEPTMREDLPELIELILKSGNISSLHTNGLKLTNSDYLRRLKCAGLDEVHLQFDGFDDEVYLKLRGERLLNMKVRALKNLERLNISTDLKVTLVRGVNEKEIEKILDFGAKHNFIKEIFFLGCRYLGRAKELPFENCLMPDEVIDIVEMQTKGRISRQEVFYFQKLFFSLLSSFSVRKCFYNQHFLVVANKFGYRPIGEFINLKRLNGRLELYKKFRAKGYRFLCQILLLSILPDIIFSKGFLFLFDFILMGILLKFGFNLNRFPARLMLVGFITACDSYNFDFEIARNCGVGGVSQRIGIQPVGALYNIQCEEY